MKEIVVKKAVKGSKTGDRIEVIFKKNRPSQTAYLFGMSCVEMIEFKDPGQLDKVTSICQSNSLGDNQERFFSLIVKNNFDPDFFMLIASSIDLIEVVKQ